MQTKNSYPSSEFEEKDRCPSCGSFCNIHSDLDDNDECNDCRNQIDGIEMGQIIPKEELKQETTLEEAAREYYKRCQLGFEKAADTERAFLRGAKWQQEQDKNKYSEEDLQTAFSLGTTY